MEREGFQTNFLTPPPFGFVTYKTLPNSQPCQEILVQNQQFQKLINNFSLVSATVINSQAVEAGQPSNDPLLSKRYNFQLLKQLLFPQLLCTHAYCSVVVCTLDPDLEDMPQKEPTALSIIINNTNFVKSKNLDQNLS